MDLTEQQQMYVRVFKAMMELHDAPAMAEDAALDRSLAICP